MKKIAVIFLSANPQLDKDDKNHYSFTQSLSQSATQIINQLFFL